MRFEIGRKWVAILYVIASLCDRKRPRQFCSGRRWGVTENSGAEPDELLNAAIPQSNYITARPTTSTSLYAERHGILMKQRNASRNRTRSRPSVILPAVRYQLLFFTSSSFITLKHAEVHFINVK